MKTSKKDAIANKRRNLLLIALPTVAILAIIILVLLWLKERNKNANPKTKTTTPGQTIQFQQEEINQMVNVEGLKANFWGELYGKADRKIKNRLNYEEKLSLPELIYKSLSGSSKTVQQAKKFLEIAARLKTIKDLMTSTGAQTVKPLESYLSILMITKNLFEELKTYIDSIKDTLDTFIQTNELYEFEANEFEAMMLVVIKVYIVDFLELKYSVFKQLESNKQLGDVDLDKNESEVYTSIGNSYIAQTDETANLFKLLKLIIQTKNTQIIVHNKTTEFENILLFLSFNIHFLLFWEIRIGADGELSVIQKLLAPKFSDDATRQHIEVLFKKIKENMPYLEHNTNIFMENTKDLLDSVIVAIAHKGSI